METATSKKSVEELVRFHFDAVARRDVDQIAADYVEDCVVDFLGQGIRRGRDEIHQFFAELFAALPDCEFIADRTTITGNVAAVEWRLRGTFTGEPLIGIEPTGRWIDHRGCDLIEFGDDGLIERNTVYQDGMELSRAIGMLPPLDSVGERGMKQAFNLATKARRAVQDWRG
jgi:steroid delta-isomerase-like uncharacterized protein